MLQEYMVLEQKVVQKKSCSDGHFHVANLEVPIPLNLSHLS